MAEVTKDGTVHVNDQFVGRLEGFQFRLDPAASAEEAKTLRAAAVSALAPEFSLRSDRMYNAPDSEFDLTEQGGLMWGTDAVGKIVKGSDVLSPAVEAFVDEEAGADVAGKVQRRLSHWLERRIAALFEPLIAMKNDEALTGLARGVGYSLVETLGIIERLAIANDIKALDQDSRGLLRKHGIRFGQYTIFQPAMLKPAPTRLRLVLKSLFDGLQEFPEAPPPGLVTIPVVSGLPTSHYTQAGYRVAGERALRIDMLERLADLVRASDTKAGFEATPDMLSLTGLSHQQFAELMKGLGYAVEEQERVKEKNPEAGKKDESADGDSSKVSESAPEAPDEAAPKAASEAAPETASEPVPSAEAVPEQDEGVDAPEIETHYIFRWKGRPRGADNQARNKKRADKRPGKKGKPPRDAGGKASSSPKRKDKPIDPDSPFAALLALKEKG